MVQGYINDIFRFSEEEIQTNRIKVRFLVQNGDGIDPLEEYFRDPKIVSNGWTLYYNKKKNFHIGDTVLSFVRKGNSWLLVAVKKITGDLGNNYFSGDDLREWDWLIGRLVVIYQNKSQNLVRIYSKLHKQIVVHQILDDVYAGERFPGYEKVNVSFKRLESILKNDITDWTTALSNTKAVYLITDQKTGRLYVGSATSQNGMLLERWRQYVETGHGGNVELKKLGMEYIRQNFKYSILRHFSSNISDQEILDCETEMKDRLCTRITGYNKN